MKRALLLLLLAAACKKDNRPPALGDAISVEQPGGSVSTLISEGSEIPTSATESFTTGHDGDKRILIHVLRGAGRGGRQRARPARHGGVQAGRLRPPGDGYH